MVRLRTSLLTFKVVHPAPGNPTGTLVNGILHHCALPSVAYSNQEEDSDEETLSDDEEMISSSSLAASVRPGIVHRLDKGTSGLLVVAKVSVFFLLLLLVAVCLFL